MFKELFKYYKAKSPAPDLSDVLDFEEPHTGGQVQSLNLSSGDDTIPKYPLPFGLYPPHTWRCYTLSKHPGIIVVRNPFTIRGQRYWTSRCLRDYPRKPNANNLNPHLFPQAVLDDWWRELCQCHDPNESRRMKIAMRWCTLGYHHDWDSKVYSEEMRGEFPKDLSSLCEYMADVLGFGKFRAQAAIVNYYPIGTTLAGHTDHSEKYLQAPLFSFSFGQTAIFLIGGQTKDERPSALYLRSGDVLIMSGESRLCYHAVPRVMKAREMESWNELISKEDTAENGSIMAPASKKMRKDYGCVSTASADDEGLDLGLWLQVVDEVFWAPFKSYLNDSRININVRQVLPEGVDKLQ